MKTKKIALLMALLLVIGALPGWSMCGAFDEWIDKQANSTNYPTKVGGMMLRGVHGFVEAPIELVWHPYDELKNRPEKGLGFFKGLGLGLWGMVEKIGYGAWDIVAALVPNYHGETPPDRHKHTTGKTT